MKKKIKVNIKSIALVVVAIILVSTFGIDMYTNAILKRIFTPYNLTGIIMTLLSFWGIKTTKKQGHNIKAAFTWIFSIFTFCSCLCTILSFFKINLVEILWLAIPQKVITAIQIIFWLFVSIIGIIVMYFIIKIIKSIINYIKEKKERKVNIQETDLESSDVSSNPQKDNLSSNVNELENNEKDGISQLTERESKIIKSICPDCGGQLIEKTNGKTKQKFIGCTNYWDKGCRFNLSAKEYSEILNKNK